MNELTEIRVEWNAINKVGIIRYKFGNTGDISHKPPPPGYPGFGNVTFLYRFPAGGCAGGSMNETPIANYDDINKYKICKHKVFEDLTYESIHRVPWGLESGTKRLGFMSEEEKEWLEEFFLQHFPCVRF